jgi:hypothetical protein
MSEHDVRDLPRTTDRPQYFGCDYRVLLDRSQFFLAQVMGFQEHIIPDADSAFESDLSRKLRLARCA